MKTKLETLFSKTEHRLTWRMYCPVIVSAVSRDAAIEEALKSQPKHIPVGTKLYYGMVTVGGEVGQAVAK